VIEVQATFLEGVTLIIPRVFEDPRGFFMETFNARDYREVGLADGFVQDNHSHSVRGVLRGLHYQYPTWQSKLIRVVSGEVFDVAVDIRRNSPTYARWIGVRLSADNKQQLYIPPGFAHGFCVTSDTADVLYKCTALYAPEEDCCVLWNDPDIGVEWPIDNPLISERDQQGVPLSAINIDLESGHGKR